MPARPPPGISTSTTPPLDAISSCHHNARSGLPERIDHSPSPPTSIRLKTMASNTTMIRFAAGFLAIISSMAVVANGQAPGPAPPPTAGAGTMTVPTIVAPAVALFFAFGLGRMLW